jgi:hypothetical protein
MTEGRGEGKGYERKRTEVRGGEDGAEEEER